MAWLVRVGLLPWAIPGLVLLGRQLVPAATARILPSDPPEHPYADGPEQRNVRTDGSIQWEGGTVFVGEAFAGDTVARQECNARLWHAQIAPQHLGSPRERSRTIVPTAGGVTHVPGHGEA